MYFILFYFGPSSDRPVSCIRTLGSFFFFLWIHKTCILIIRIFMYNPLRNVVWALCGPRMKRRNECRTDVDFLVEKPRPSGRQYTTRLPLLALFSVKSPSWMELLAFYIYTYCSLLLYVIFCCLFYSGCCCCDVHGGTKGIQYSLSFPLAIIVYWIFP